MKKNNLFYTTACVATLSAMAGYAATVDPTAADSANGTMIVKLKVEELVRMSNLDDIDLGTYDPSSTTPATATEEFCIYYNHGSDVNITLTSANAASGFNLAGVGTPANKIGYIVGMSDDVSGGAPTYAVHAEAANVNYSSAGSIVDDDCATGITAGNTAGISVTIGAIGLLGVPSDTYQDTITIKVVPQP